MTKIQARPGGRKLTNLGCTAAPSFTAVVQLYHRPRRTTLLKLLLSKQIRPCKQPTLLEGPFSSAQFLVTCLPNLDHKPNLTQFDGENCLASVLMGTAQRT